MPFALSGEDCETALIDSNGVLHRIVFGIDPIRQTPRPLIERRPSSVKTGTNLTVLWPERASSILERAKPNFFQLAETFSWLNPHLSLSLTWNGDIVFEIGATLPDWSRWKPSALTSAHWYNPETLQRLIGAEVAFAEDHGLPQRPVRDFIADFRGLTGTGKTKVICDGLNLSRRSLADVVLDPSLVARLLHAMKEGSRAPKPKDLGVIGRDHLLQRFIAAGAQEDSFDYQVNAFEHDGLPYVVEVAFAYAPGLAERVEEGDIEEDEDWDDADEEEIERREKKRDRVRRMVTGLNFSASVGANPFRELRDRQGLDGLLNAQYAGPDEPVIVFVHLTTPRLQFLDQGQILGGATVMSVAKDHRRHAGENHRSRLGEAAQGRKSATPMRAFRRSDRMSRRHRPLHQTEAAARLLPAAYLKASANGTLPANPRCRFTTRRAARQDAAADRTLGHR